MAQRSGERRQFGQIIKLPSGRYKARYSDPEGRRTATGEPVRHNSPQTWGHKDMRRQEESDARGHAEAWLRAEKKLIDEGLWSPPAERRDAMLRAEALRMPTFGEYAEQWIATRRNKRTGKELASRTQEHYRRLLADYLEPFAALPLDQVTATGVNLWYDAFTPKSKNHQGKKTTGDTTRAHVYALGRAIMNTATGAHGPLVGQVNPFAVRGGGSTDSRRRDEQLATASDVQTILDTIAEPYRLMVLLALWCGLRYSEIAELRRSDIDLVTGLVKVRRAVADRSGGVKGPKSAFGNRDIHMPAPVAEAMHSHLRTLATGREGLLFPGKTGGHLKPSTFYGKLNGAGWYAARAAAGREDLHFHDLRATGATLLAQNGATEAEIQAWLGDSTPQAAQRYVRAARSRMRQHADRMSELAARADW